MLHYGLSRDVRWVVLELVGGGGYCRYWLDHLNDADNTCLAILCCLLPLEFEWPIPFAFVAHVLEPIMVPSVQHTRCQMKETGEQVVGGVG